MVNAYIGPIVGGYVRNLETRLKAAGFTGDLAIMQSNGGVMAPAAATKRPVMMMESGPVGGIIASAEIGKALGQRNIISFDMGGTTAKAALVRDGEPTTAEGYYVGGYASGHPVMVPVVDVVEVGAGGGSIAWIDDVGALKVGPQSSGADPGPICYRNGGTEPTITDANVVLGRIGAGDFLGGEMRLDAEAARAGHIGARRRTARHERCRSGARHHRHRGCENVAWPCARCRSRRAMTRAISRSSPRAERGRRTRSRSRASCTSRPSSSRASPRISRRSACSWRTSATISAALITRNSTRPISPKLAEIAGEMAAEGKRILSREDGVTLQLLFDLRYVGQEFALSVPVSWEQLRAADRAAIRTAFDALHEQRYAHHSTDEPVEIINLRLIARGQRAKLAMPPLPREGSIAPAEQRQVWFDGAPVRCPVYRRDGMPAGAKLVGPALISEYGSTTVLFPGDRVSVAATGELIISVEKP